MTIKHRAGARHGKADGLSRVPVQEHQNVARTVNHRSNGVQSTDDGQIGDNEITVWDAPPHEGPDVEREALTKAQMEDPDIGPVLRLIMHSPEAPDIGQLTPETPGVKRTMRTMPDRTLGLKVRRRTPWTAPAEEHGADEGNRRMGWCGRPEEGVGAVGGHPADIYSVWSTRPEPGKGGLAPALEGHRDDTETEVCLKGQDPSWHRDGEDQTAILSLALPFCLVVISATHTNI